MYYSLHGDKPRIAPMIVAKLHADVAETLRIGGSSMLSLAVREVLARYGASLALMHPGKTGALGRTCVVDAPAGVDEQRLADDLARAPGVEGAYTKPAAEPPNGA
jgi:hypothetical protein